MGIFHELCWHDRGHFRFLRAYLNTPPFAYILYAAVHWRTVYGPYVEYAAVAVNSPYNIFRIGAAIGTEDAYVQAVMARPIVWLVGIRTSGDSRRWHSLLLTSSTQSPPQRNMSDMADITSSHW